METPPSFTDILWKKGYFISSIKAFLRSVYPARIKLWIGKQSQASLVGFWSKNLYACTFNKKDKNIKGLLYQESREYICLVD